MKLLYEAPFSALEKIETDNVLLESIDLPEDEFDVEAPSQTSMP